MTLQATAHSPAAEIALEIYRRTLEEIRGDHLIQAHVARTGDHLRIKDTQLDLTQFDRVMIAGAGKASASMALGLESILADRLSPGLIITKISHLEPLAHCQLLEAAHPIPDQSSLDAGQAMLDFAAQTTERDLVLFVLSGGASALMEQPVPGVTLQDLQQASQALLASGATITSINAIRSRLSKIKAGGLARAFDRATVVVLIMSDVAQDNLAVIGYGPFVPANPELDPVQVLDAYNLRALLPPRVVDLLEAPSHPVSVPQVTHIILANAATMGETAKRIAIERGLSCFASNSLSGEAQRALDIYQAKRLLPTNPGTALIAYGEPTVTLKGKGLGGRAQEVACAAAIQYAGDPKIAVLCAGSDGTDGPTDAAGALIDGQTLTRAQQNGQDAHRALAENDTYHFHEAGDSLIKTGPTGSNLTDLLIVVRA